MYVCENLQYEYKQAPVRLSMLEVVWKGWNSLITVFRIITIPVVFNLGSIEPHGFGESVSGVSAVWFTPLVCALHIVIYICFEFKEKKSPIRKGSMNACMELVGFSTSNKVKNLALQ